MNSPFAGSRRARRAAALIGVLAVAGCVGGASGPDRMLLIRNEHVRAPLDAGPGPAPGYRPARTGCANRSTFINDCSGFARYDGP